jgi:hypothetical protein
MKKLLAVAACVLAVLSAYAQGTVDFKNKATTATGALDAPVFDVGGIVKLEGPNAWAQLYAGPTADALVAVGAAAPFRTGTGAGYWNAAPDTGRTIASVAPGAAAFVQVKAWKGAAGSTFDSATERGLSAVFNVTTGGAGSPPSLPSALVGLQSFSLVPEPSLLALGAIGVAGLLLRRRS